MAKSRYEVSGTVKNRGSFMIEVEAESEAHARKLALSRVGSSQRIRETMITLKSVKKL